MKKIFLSFLVLTLLATANSLRPAELRWAGDSEGGAPFIFQDPRDPEKLIGCEVEIMQDVARRLGLKSVFVQNTWDGLIPGLDRGDYDLALNAIEITDERAKVIDFSVPYYVTYEQLAVPSGDYETQSLSDLKGKRISTYKGALAQSILEARGFTPILYEAIEPIYRDLLIGRADAALLDYPLALYCGKVLDGVKFVGAPVSRMEYGIVFRKKDSALRAKVNSALLAMRRDGTLRRIFERWNLWSDMMAEWSGDFSPSQAQPDAWLSYLESRGEKLDWNARLKRYASYLPLLLRGAWTTLLISVLGMSLAMLLGLSLTLNRLHGPSGLRWLSAVYVEVFRGTPLLIQLFIIFYGLPHFGIKLAPLAAAVIGLGLNYAAYEAENYRAGLLSVAKGQWEACQALGLSKAQSLRHVILPQAFRVSLPPVTNDFISILKDSSLVSVITMVELTKVYGQLASATYDWLGLGLLTAAMYFLIGLPFVMLARRVEKRFKKA